MRQVTGWTCFLVLAAIALLHVYWGFGGVWPAHSEADLVRTVIGTQADRMPEPGITFIVAALIFIAGSFALLRGVLNRDSFIFIRVPLFGLFLIFLARGLVSYIPGVFPPPAQPFGELNTAFYSPLILALALGFGYLTVSPRR